MGKKGAIWIYAEELEERIEEMEKQVRALKCAYSRLSFEVKKPQQIA